MRLPPTVPAQFLRRDNRYRVTCLLDGQEVAAHLSDPGRLRELLTPGRPLWLAPRDGAARKTAYDVLLVDKEGVLVSVMPRLANDVLEEALGHGWLMGPCYPERRREVRLGASRIDLLLSGPSGRCWVEAKSCSLVEGRLALFPDAPTVRGRRHVIELAEAVDQGDAAALVFVIQRGDADRLAPHREIDPGFAQALAEAQARGVGVHALACDVSRGEIRVSREVPVLV